MTAHTPKAIKKANKQILFINKCFLAILNYFFITQFSTFNIDIYRENV